MEMCELKSRDTFIIRRLSLLRLVLSMACEAPLLFGGASESL